MTFHNVFDNFARAAIQRIDDWRRERRITALADAAKRSISVADYCAVRRAYSSMIAEVLLRSPSQIARMERRLGIGGRAI